MSPAGRNKNFGFGILGLQDGTLFDVFLLLEGNIVKRVIHPDLDVVVGVTVVGWAARRDDLCVT
jgi:hypothetical protein